MAQRPRIFMQEVAPRDGFQAESVFIPTEDKVAIVDALSATGLAKVEVTSFVSPKAIPALADATAVMAAIRRVPGVEYTALVPNVKGAARAIECRLDEMNLVMSVSETHNLANLRMLPAQSFRQLSDVVRLAREAGCAVNVSLSCAFGCPMEGDVPATTTLAWAGRFIDLGVRGITLCDTTGMAYPTQVRELHDAFTRRWPGVQLTLHFHNTRGMGCANIFAAVQAGARRFDASLGGLGGCPYAPGATGNVCTEDAVHMLELCGYDTGVSLDALVACSRELPRLVGHDVPGQVAKAGARLKLHPPPAALAEIRARAEAQPA